jgi:uncharacterized protein
MDQTSQMMGWIRTASNGELEDYLMGHSMAAGSTTAEGVSLLLFAVYCRNQQAVEIIKKHKPSLDAYEAACIGEKTVLEKMLDANPEIINSPSPDGFSLLGYACFFGQADIARLLIDRHALVNQASANAFKVTPLHSACANSDYELAALLLQNGADVNARQASGFTPLHSAANNGQTALAQLLLDAGADPDAATDDGELPYDIAVKKSFSETAECIRSYERGM